jgi:hypothetical protein
MIIALLILTSKTFPDNRLYVWTYEYKTMERGEAELEYYLTFSTPDRSHLKGNMSAEHQLELEVGMTDNFDFSIYQTFQQDPNEYLRYTGFKARSRYKIGKKGDYFFDPLIYLEYKGKQDFSEHGIELKLIFAKDIGKINIAINPYFEFERENDWEFLPKYSAGTSYMINKLLRLGFEIKGNKYGHYIGPVISHGKDDLWVTLGSAFQVGKVKEGKPEFQIRMLLGIGFGGEQKKH